MLMHALISRRFSFSITESLAWLANVALGGGILLVPFRLRFVIFAQPIPPIYHDYTDGLLFLSDILFIAALSFWVMRVILEKRRPTIGPLFMAVPLAGLTLIGLISIFWSVNPLLSVYHSMRMIMLDGLYLYLVNELKGLEDIIWPVAGQAVIQAVIGITQVLRQHSLGLQGLGEYELDPSWSGVSIVWAQGIRTLRAYGLSDHPNILGGCLAFSLILLIAWYITDKSNHQILKASMIILISLALLVTFSRSAWLGLAAGLLLMTWLLLRSRQPQLFTRVIEVLVASLLIALPFVWQNLPLLGVRLNQGQAFQQVGTEQRSLAERATLNAAGNEIFAAHAFSGVGLGAYVVALKQAMPDFPYNYQPPHVALLNAAVETGLPGVFFYTALLIIPWVATWLNRKRLSFTPAFIGILSALAAITVVGFFDYYTWLLAPGRFWLWFIWGLWGAMFTPARKELHNV